MSTSNMPSWAVPRRADEIALRGPAVLQGDLAQRRHRSVALAAQRIKPTFIMMSMNSESGPMNEAR